LVLTHSFVKVSQPEYSGPFGGGSVLPDPFRGIGTRRNSAETQKSGYAPRDLFGLLVKLPPVITSLTTQM